MNQPPVGFQKIVAIDWSGAANPFSTPAIQVAEYFPATGILRLVHPQHGNRWSRTDVVNYVQHAVNAYNEGPVLIGFDFAFAYPYCDQDAPNLRAYFPGVNADAQPRNPRALWAEVEQWCQQVDNFYGAAFYANPDSPYHQFFRYQANRHVYTGARYERRFRITDNAAAGQAGHQPNSVFNCIGPANVGTGSVAGMRVLHELLARVQDGRMESVSIWPFDPNGLPPQSAIVEIYPRLFLNHTMGGNYFGAALQNVPPTPTPHKRDALVSAAGMGWFIQHGMIEWQLPDAEAARLEGWIFGAPAP